MRGRVELKEGVEKREEGRRAEGCVCSVVVILSLAAENKEIAAAKQEGNSEV